MSLHLTDKSAVYRAIQPLLTANSYLKDSGLGDELIHLISMRASQINGCAYCLALHQKTLREAGQREDRLAVLPAWREAADWFSERERAALAWTEAVTILDNREVPDDVIEQARAAFSEQELVDLTLAVTTINGFNRFNVAFHNPPVAFEIDQPAIAAD